MSDATAALLQVVALLVALALAYRPLGDYMARVYVDEHHTRVERGLYRVMGVDPDADQRWAVYARSLLAFSFVSVLGLYTLQRLQPHLPLSLGFPGVAPDQAFNTAASFVTNTNWQSYSGESTMGHLAQMAGLAVQNFVSAAVGIAVAVALVRGFRASPHRPRSATSGSTWSAAPCVSCCRSRSSATLVLVALGAVQNLCAGTEVTSSRARPRPSPVGRSPRRRSSRSWAPTAAASTTPTPPTPSRTRPRSPTWSRSSCSC